MSPLLAVIVIVALVAFTVTIGVGLNVRAGRVRAVGSPEQRASITPAELGPSIEFGENATLIQLSTPLCATCGPTHRTLSSLAAGYSGVAHVDIDLSQRPELAQRWNVLQTPTILLVDSDGVLHARSSGAARVDELTHKLAEIIRSPRVSAE